MSKPFTPKVVTANALLEGDVIYLTADDQWSRNIIDAEVIEDAAHGDLRMLLAQSNHSEVVGPYFADVRLTESGPSPVHFREKFRTRGPANYNHANQEIITKLGLE